MTKSENKTSNGLLLSQVQNFIGPIILILGFLLILGIFSLLAGIIMTIAGFSIFEIDDDPHPTQVAGPTCLVLGLFVTIGSAVGLSCLKGRARAFSQNFELNTSPLSTSINNSEIQIPLQVSVTPNHLSSHCASFPQVHRKLSLEAVPIHPSESPPHYNTINNQTVSSKHNY